MLSFFTTRVKCLLLHKIAKLDLIKSMGCHKGVNKRYNATRVNVYFVRFTSLLLPTHALFKAELGGGLPYKHCMALLTQLNRAIKTV